MNDNPMTQKRLDDMEDERERGIVMPPYHHRHPEVMQVPASFAWIELLAAVLFYCAIVGLGVVVGLAIWG